MTRIEEIYHQMVVLGREIKERNELLDKLLEEAIVIVDKGTATIQAETREPVHHTAYADPANMHVLAGTLPPNILKK